MKRKERRDLESGPAPDEPPSFGSDKSSTMKQNIQEVFGPRPYRRSKRAAPNASTSEPTPGDVARAAQWAKVTTSLAGSGHEDEKGLAWLLEHAHDRWRSSVIVRTASRTLFFTNIGDPDPHRAMVRATRRDGPYLMWLHVDGTEQARDLCYPRDAPVALDHYLEMLTAQRQDEPPKAPSEAPD